jgi:hypothetical protein
MINDKQDMVPRSWLKECITYFRQHGFFSRMLVDDYVDIIVDQLNQVLGQPLDLNNHERPADLKILSYDQEKVWAIDTEIEHSEGDYFYVRMLLDWSKISGSVFSPQNLSEIWNADDIITISFTAETRDWSIDLDYAGGWFDFKILDLVNSIVEPSGKHFIAYDYKEDQCAHIFFLAENDFQRITTDRKWLGRRI